MELLDIQLDTAFSSHSFKPDLHKRSAIAARHHNESIIMIIIMHSLNHPKQNFTSTNFTVSVIVTKVLLLSIIYLQYLILLL